MLKLYYKLKLKICLNRLKYESSEEKYGRITGYVLLWLFIAFIGYVILNVLFSKNYKSISSGLMLYFVFVTIVNIGDNFNKIYESLFERADKHILYMFPMGEWQIICINMLDSTWEFLKTYILLVFPVCFSLLFFDIHNIAIVVALVVGCLCISIVIVGVLTIVLLETIRITKGRNIKIVSVALTVLFSTAATLLVYSNQYLKIIENKLLVNILLMPIGYIARTLRWLYMGDNNLMLDMLCMLVYIVVIMGAYFTVFRGAINNGVLLIDADYITNVPVLRIFNLKILKRVRNKKEYLSDKDIKGVFSSYELVKNIITSGVMCILVYKYLIVDMDIIYIGLFFLTKSLVMVIKIIHYLYQYESRNLALIFSIMENKEIMESKSNTCLKLLLPFCVIFDLAILMFESADICEIIICLIFDILFLVILAKNCSYNIIKYAQVKEYTIRFSVEGLLSYIENVIVIQTPLGLGYGILIYIIKSNSAGMLVLGSIFAVLLVLVSVCVSRKKTKYIYRDTLEFL